MNEEQLLRTQTEIAGALSTAIAGLAAVTAKHLGSDTYLSDLVTLYEITGEGQESPIQRLVFQQLAQAVEKFHTKF